MPDTATLPRSGLFTTANVPVPLDGVSIEADISNLCARVVIAQRFVNREEQPIEAVYVFPLDEGAAVCGFEAIVDGTLVVGEVKEREAAFRAYDDAMERGDGAFLLDEERPDVFQASVGNLPPGKDVLLKLTYVTELSVKAGSVRFVIPTTVSPRYAPAEDHLGVGRPDAETLNPPVQWSVPYGLDLSVRLGMSGGVERVESPSHPIAVALAGGGATVTLSQREAALDRDFVLSLDTKALEAPQAWVETAEDGQGAVAIAFVPALPETVAAAEVIFVVDRSGSMGGDSIQEVRNALQLCVRSLVNGCRFNIIGFGSRIDPLFSASRAYDETSLGAASAHIAAMDADLGGTAILPALQFALEAPRHGSLTRQVVVLTDGEVSNTDAVLALARRHAADARIFTFGIGAGASHHLVNGLARAGRGSAEVIYPGERIEPKVVRQLGRLLSPVITNLRVDWGALDVTQTPATVPPVFAGERLLLYGLMRSGMKHEGLTTVRLAADGPAGPLGFDVPVDPSRAEAGRVVSTLAARARIRELEESPDWLASRGSRQRERKTTGVRAEIIELSIRYGLVSRETSYVAVERRETPVIGDVQLRRVPIALTTGWGGGTQAHARPAPMAALFSGALKAKVDVSYQGADVHESRLGADRDGPSFLDGMVLRRKEPRLSAPLTPDVLGPMHTLIDLQRADGAWDLTPPFADALRCDLRELESVLVDLGGDAEASTAWATALALAWLERHARDAENLWWLLARKGHEWLHSMPAVRRGRKWLDLARDFVRDRTP